MKKVFSVAIAATLLLAPFIVFGQEQAPAPNIKAGDFWQFKAREYDFVGSSSNTVNGIYEISYVQGGAKFFYLTGDKKEELDPKTLAGAVLFAYLGRGKIFQDLKFPLSVGDKWNYEYRGAAAGGKAKARSVEIRVTGVEQVTTAAGTFRAFKLEKDDRTGPRDFWLTSFYYSPETKSVVKSFLDGSSGTGSGGKREIELIKFGSAP